MAAPTIGSRRLHLAVRRHHCLVKSFLERLPQFPIGFFHERVSIALKVGLEHLRQSFRANNHAISAVVVDDCDIIRRRSQADFRCSRVVVQATPSPMIEGVDETLDGDRILRCQFRVIPWRRQP